ncbi:MAG: 2-hydroxy-3-oxopropionate reductase [Chloroflexota bacterium]|jgi:3-hydroxyisobutyrate dehydrogenase/2-hydroxy-3-oxopropionate reductase|nr:2-hydroxy-3-oxopropionate reductase [Chloroflexota bacterium]
MTTVAILGTGRMGSAMARALAADGHRLALYNRTRKTARALADQLGAQVAEVAESPAAAVAAADVVISMVADGDAVMRLYEGDGDRGGAPGALGALEGLRPGHVVLEMSTVLPEVSRSLEGRVRARGAGILDAPVSGSVSLAETGQLTIMVGGEGADLERARPVLESLSARIFHMGPLGSGAVMKLAVNNAVMGLNQTISESLVLAERAGIERSKAYEVFAGSAVGAPFVQYKRSAFVTPDDTAVAFSIDLAAKDMGLILDLGEQVGADLPQAEIDIAVLHEIADAGGGGRDLSSVASHLRDTADRSDRGVPVRHEGVPMT